MKIKPTYRIIIFYVIAITVSNIFRFDIFNTSNLTSELNPSFIILLVILEGIGVLIGALIAIQLMKKVKPSSMSLFGTSKTKSLLLFMLPIIVFTIIGINNQFENVANNKIILYQIRSLLSTAMLNHFGHCLKIIICPKQ